MTGILITWLITTISFLIISRLPIGVEIDSFGKAAISAAVFGILNALLRPILGFFTFPFILLTFGLFLFVLNAIIFGLAAWLVPGFRLRWGFWSALIGSIALTIINSLIFRLLGAL
ncbi:phage holin family protein [Microcoleus sp. FACHB-SPT15]|uniref:phage holin family protein n=1 Tax=Microcoleus sp. FACHB-SPT15 TaxID=2692830 RepID=UPI001783A634|nr:phage holin family protein [Microcoleus sp. FACHB-SPT15]MBD1805558.1 phage holin family protein [Microcoleus sp. FACHB-SPT15]